MGKQKHFTGNLAKKDDKNEFLIMNMQISPKHEN